MISTGTRRLRITYKALIRVLLFLFLCGCTGHKRGFGFDAVFCRLTFVAMMGVQLLKSIRERKLRFRSSTLWLMAFIGLYLLSGLWSDDMGNTYSTVILSSFIQILGTVWVIENNFRTRADYLVLTRYIFWAIVYMAVLLFIRTPVTMWGSERIGDAMGLNANTIGIWAADAVLLSLMYAEKTKKYYLLSVVLIAIALFSGSRKAFAMVVMEIVLFFAFRDRGWKTLRNFAVAAGLAVLLVYVVFYIPSFYDVLGYRLERSVNALRGITSRNAYGMAVQDVSGLERAFYRKRAMELFLQNPVLGCGGNGFVTYLERISYSHVAYSHCNYTELLCTLGAAGFFLYYGYLLQGLIIGIRRFFATREREILVVALLLFSGLLIQYFYVSYYSVLDMILLACCVNIVKVRTVRACARK